MRFASMRVGSLLATAIIVSTFGASRVTPTLADSGTPAAGVATPTATPVGGWRPWQMLELTNVKTGASFTFADFSRRTVVVQAMATWCPSCRAQLKDMKSARTSLHDDNVVFVAVSVETTLSAADLSNYAKTEGFDWVFAVATPEMLRALVDEFGRILVNPPATPHFLIYPNGSFSKLQTGEVSSAELLRWITTPASK